MDMNEQPADAEVIVPVVAGPQAAPKSNPNAVVRLGQGVLFQSVAEVWAVADGLRKGGAGPKGSTTGSIAASIIKGQTLGLDPVTAMSFITVVNGRASLMGDLALGLIRKTGLVNPKSGGFLREAWEGEGETRRCVMSACRHDTGEEMSRSFSVAEARKAGLIGKTAIWSGFQDRMLRYRALGFLLRDLFSDVLMGLYLTEELQGGDAFAGPALPPAPEAAALPVDARPADPFFEPEAESQALALPAGAPQSPQEAAPEAEVTLDPSLVQIVEPEPEAAPEAPSSDEPEGGIAAIFDGLASTFAKAVQADAATRDPFEGFRDDPKVPEKIEVKPPTRKEKPKPRRPAPAPTVGTSTVTVVRNDLKDPSKPKPSRLF